MDDDGVWGTEVEILAASAILQTDIYVASECELVDESSPFRFSKRFIYWNRYSATPNYDEKLDIYIANFQKHYEPVVNFINSVYPTYGKKDKEVICID